MRRLQLLDLPKFTASVIFVVFILLLDYVHSLPLSLITSRCLPAADIFNVLLLLFFLLLIVSTFHFK